MRVPGVAAAAFVEALGCASESMAFNEIYNAMSQGVLDACEAPLSVLASYSLQEVAKNIFLTEHSLAPSCWAMSANIYNSLSENAQQVLTEEIRKYGEVFTEQSLETQAGYRATLEEAGVTFVDPSESDIAALQAAGKACYDLFPDMTPGIYDAIQEIIQ